MDKLISKNDLIFVAGHKGMAGSSIIRSLRKKGYKKFIFADRKELDLRDYLKVMQWFNFNKPDVVIDAAAKVGGILANRNMPADFIFDNLKIQLNVIESAWKNDVKRLLFLGSSCIYPKFAKQPIKEEYLLNGTLEKTNESYAIAKIAGIKMCESLREQYGFDAICAMPTNLYGPGDSYNLENSHVLPALIRRFYEAKLNNKDNVLCWGSGNPLREFLHVDDLGDACVFLLENWYPKNEELKFINIGTGIDISIKDLANKVSKLIKYNGNIIWDKDKPDGTFKKQLDIVKIKKLGWKSRITLQEGLERTIKDFINELESQNLRI